MKYLLTFLLLALGATSAEAQFFWKEVREVTVTPTVDTAAYAQNDCIGGLMTFPALLCGPSKSGRVIGAKVLDRSDTANAVEYNILIFKSSPAGTFTDQAACAPADADLLLLNPVINLGTADCFVFATNGICSLSSLNSAVRSASTGSGSGSVYVALQTEGAPDYEETTSLSLVLTVECD